MTEEQKTTLARPRREDVYTASHPRAWRRTRPRCVVARTILETAALCASCSGKKNMSSRRGRPSETNETLPQSDVFHGLTELLIHAGRRYRLLGGARRAAHDPFPAPLLRQRVREPSSSRKSAPEQQLQQTRRETNPRRRWPRHNKNRTQTKRRCEQQTNTVGHEGATVPLGCTSGRGIA